MTSIWVHPRGRAALHDTESLRDLDYNATVDDGEVGVSFDPGSDDLVIFYANSYAEIADALERAVVQLRRRETRDRAEQTTASQLADAIRAAERAAEADSNDAEITAWRDALELALSRWPEIGTPVAP